MKSKKWHRPIYSPLLAMATTAVSLFLASYILFPPGTGLTYRATFLMSENHRVTETLRHSYPGLMSQEDVSGRVLYALVYGCFLGLPAGILLSRYAQTTYQRRFGWGFLATGCFLEYSLESFLVLMLNSQHYEPFAGTESSPLGETAQVIFWPWQGGTYGRRPTNS
jgi:hypothetical protein